MEWISPVVAALGVMSAFFAGNGVSRLRRSGRLREGIASDQLILDRLDKGGTAHGKLTSHIEKRVQLLVAEETPYEADERTGQRVGWFCVTLGIAGIAGMSAEAIGYAPIEEAWAAVLIILGVGLFAGVLYVGVHIIMTATSRRNQRRDKHRKDIDQQQGKHTGDAR